MTPGAGLTCTELTHGETKQLRTDPSLDASQALSHALAGLLLPATAAAAETPAEPHALLLLRLLRLLRLLLLEPCQAAAGHGATQQASEAAGGLPTP